MHYCAYHKVEEPEENFRLKPNGRLDSWCIEGRREYNRKYSREIYAPQKAEVARRRAELEANPLTTRVCIDCGLEKSVEEFPERNDRPGKRHTRCDFCHSKITKERMRQYNIENFEKIAIKKRAYHASHPRYNEQSSRNRRARQQRVRQEPFTREAVRERDQGLCYFCGQPVDPTLIWPHPWSEVVHHIHPLAKKGPNVLGNVAIAHNRCNGRHKDKCANPFVDWQVKQIGNRLARTIAKERHYLRRAPSTSFAFGLFSPSREAPVGIITFGTPSSWRINLSVCPDAPKNVIELNRLWIAPDAPFGAASWFVSRALKMLPPYIVVSYADISIQDPRNNRSHDGSVYRALSFNYAGRTRSRKEWRLPGKSRNVGKVPGAELCEVTSKHRFWTITGNRRDKRILQSICEWPSLPYDLI